MAPIMEVLGPLLVAAFIPQSPEDQQQGLIPSTLSTTTSTLLSSTFRQLMTDPNSNQFHNRARRLIQGLFCSSSTSPYNHLSFAGDAAAQIFTNNIGGKCWYPSISSSSSSSSMFASAFTPNSRTTATTRSSALLAVAASGNGMIDPSFASSSSNSKLQVVTSSVLNLLYDIHGGGGSQSTYSSNPTISIVSSSFLDGIQKNAHALGFMVLLALQFGLQPILTKKFTPKTVNRSTIVLAQEMVKFIVAGCILYFTGTWTDAFAGWDLKTSMMISGLPAALYTIQNVVTLIAYQNLDPITFNVLNQTKTLSAALCVYLLMGKVQTQMQILSLGILFLASCVIEKIVNLDALGQWWISKVGRGNHHPTDPVVTDKTVNEGAIKPVTNTPSTSASNHAQGVAAVLTASFISGLAGAFTQKSLQGSQGKDSYLFTMELCVASIFFLASSMLANPKDRKQLISISDGGFFKGWTPQTIIPILTNAAGGIIVGLVTKYAGAVKKGFALIFGLLLSGILQARMAGVSDEQDNKPRITKEQIVGGLLAALSLWMHSAFPSR